MGSAASTPPAGDPAPGTGQAGRSTDGGPRPTSVVMFVRDLEPSVDFYRNLLLMEVTVRTATAALLVGTGGVQLYVRAMGPGGERPLGAIGVQYVIWAAADRDDLDRCERVLTDLSAHTSSTRLPDGSALVEGRDPSGLPLMVAYPGPEQWAHHEIMARIYAW